jgi:hypothetical protein
MEFSDSATCGTTPTCATATLTANVCRNVNELSHCAGAVSLDMTLVAGTSVVGSCTPAPVRNVPQYTWGIQARGCVSTVAPAQVDCASGQICAPTPEQGSARRPRSRASRRSSASATRATWSAPATATA